MFPLGPSAQHKVGPAGNCLWSKHTHGYSYMPGVRTLRALNPGSHLGQVMDEGTLWPPSLRLRSGALSASPCSEVTEVTQLRRAQRERHL